MKTIFLDNSGRATSEVSLSFRRGGSKGPNMRPVPHTGQLMGSAETKRQPFRFSDSSVPSPYQDAFTKQTLTQNSSVRTSEISGPTDFPMKISICATTHQVPSLAFFMLNQLWFCGSNTEELGKKAGSGGQREGRDQRRWQGAPHGVTRASHWAKQTPTSTPAILFPSFKPWGGFSRSALDDLPVA